MREKRKPEDFSLVGRTFCERVIKRAKLQMEKVGYTLTKRDQIPMLLDPRVMRTSAFTVSMRFDAKIVLEEEYINYWLNVNPTATATAGTTKEASVDQSAGLPNNCGFDYSLSTDEAES